MVAWTVNPANVASVEAGAESGHTEWIGRFNVHSPDTPDVEADQDTSSARSTLMHTALGSHLRALHTSSPAATLAVHTSSVIRQATATGQTSTYPPSASTRTLWPTTTTAGYTRGSWAQGDAETAEGHTQVSTWIERVLNLTLTTTPDLDLNSSDNMTTSYDDVTGLSKTNMTFNSLDTSGALSGGSLMEDSPMAPLALLTIVLLSVMGNVFVCMAIKLDRKLHQMTYYFLVSMALLHIAMAIVVMPPAIMVLIQGTFTYNEEVCKLWITLDLFFCNNTCLHLAFINMDTFLRLKDPLRHGRILTTCSLVLWLGASWVISFVQGIAQFMLSQADHGIIRDGICFIADKNFLILGTLFSFLIPSGISLGFYVLCAKEIRALKRGKFLDESEGSNINAFNYGSHESLADDMSDSTSCGGSDVEEHVPREQVQLAVVTSVREGHRKEVVNNMEEMTSFCDDENQNEGGVQEGEVSKFEGQDGQGHTNLAFADHLISTDQSSSCTLLLRDSGSNNQETPVIRQDAENDHSCPDESLRHEIVISRLMLILIIFTITLWIPYSVSNIVYGICPSCKTRMTFEENLTFKWLAYSSAMMGPIIYSKFSDTLREAYFRILTCDYCRN